MKKKLFKLMSLFFGLALLLTGLQFNSSFLETAHAATGLDMNGYTIKGYPYSDSHFPVYNSTGSGKRQIGTCYGNEDLITIHGVGSDGWSLITYPAGRTTKTGYCWTSYLFQNVDFSGSAGNVRSNITTYRKPGCGTKYGTSTTGDQVFILGSANGNTQILYPCGSYYKMAWIKGSYTINNGTLTNSGNDTDGVLHSPVPSGCKFNRKTNDGGWYGYHDINRGVSSTTPVYAIADGTVTYKQAYRIYNGVKKLTSYGNFIEFQSSDGIYTAKYCHLSGFSGANQIISSYNSVRASGSTGVYRIKTRTVRKGEIIGYIGQTGNASGVHLHFELRKNGTRIDPASVIGGLK